MDIKLERPVVFVDLETTGISRAYDRIVEFTFIKMHPNGSEDTLSARLNPGIPIPSSATDVHGITDSDVKDEPAFKECALRIKEFLENCDIAGFGVKRFDLPILASEFDRAAIAFSRKGRRILDAQRIYHHFEPRDLTAAYKKYCGKELENAHTSKADAMAAIEVLKSQLKMHPELPKDIEGLHKFCNEEEASWIDPDGRFVWSGGEAIISFGEHKGKSLKEISKTKPDYFQWIIGKDFSPEVKEIAKNALENKFPVSG